MLSEAAIWRFHLTMLDDPFIGYAGPRLAFYDNCNLLEGVPGIDGFYSLYLKHEREVGWRLYATEKTVLEPMADFLGVSQFSDPDNPVEWRPRKICLPLLIGGQRPIFADDKTAMNAVLQPEFQPRRQLYLPLAAQSYVTATNETKVAIRNAQFTAHRIEADVEAATEALVSIAQAYYHSWHAYIDGRETRLWRANYAFQAVAVPAGQHKLTLVYQDRWFYAGAILSFGTFIVCLWRLRSLGRRVRAVRP
ncbi:MAG: YfhO family protein [Chloroflexi bacterium]|nr:YfhO family protein [Chloroflexota bacterium]